MLSGEAQARGQGSHASCKLRIALECSNNAAIACATLTEHDSDETTRTYLAKERTS